MLLVASSSPPFSPPPPCGDEKEEDSAEEEEADGGGGGAPRDLGWAGAGRGGPGTAPLEPRVLGNRPRSAASGPRRPARAWAQARPLALAPTFSVESASLSGRRDPAESKRNFPHPPTPGRRRSPPSPLRGAGRDPGPKKRFFFPEASRLLRPDLRKN